MRRQPAPCVRRVDRVRGPWRSVSWGSRACRPPRTCPRQRELASADSPWTPGPTVQAPGPGSAFRPWLLGVCLLRPSPTPSPSPSWPLSRQCAPSSHDTPQRAWPPPEMSCAPGVPRPWVPPGSGRSRPRPPPEQEAAAASHGVRDRDGTRRGRLEGAPIHAPRAAGGTPNTRPGSFRAGAPNPPRRGLRLSELTPLGCR